MGTENGTRGDGAQYAALGKGGYVEQAFVGVVIGLTVGLVLAVSAAIFDAWTHAGERREQIAFFRELLDKMQEVCNDTAGLKTEQVERSAEQMRHFHLRMHARHLRSALDGRSTRLAFDEIYEVENVHYYIQMVLSQADSSIFSKGACSELVSELKSTSLLGR